MFHLHSACDPRIANLNSRDSRHRAGLGLFQIRVKRNREGRKVDRRLLYPLYQEEGRMQCIIADEKTGPPGRSGIGISSPVSCGRENDLASYFTCGIHARGEIILTWAQPYLRFIRA